jgi:Fe-Mn family superoxide dismutase
VSCANALRVVAGKTLPRAARTRPRGGADPPSPARSRSHATHLPRPAFRENPSPDGGDRPAGPLRDAIDEHFGHRGGTGTNTPPLLALDAWEHAYYLRYRNVRPDHVEKLCGPINWEDVARRFADVTSQAA